MKFFVLALSITVGTAVAHGSDPHSDLSSTWRGLVVAQEQRCAPYNKKTQYPYPQRIEDEIIRAMNGRIYGPYTGRYFASKRQTDIEHIVAASEGHDSGLCAASPEIRKSFAVDPLNLTLASPAINRCGKTGKCGLDAGEWLPAKNKCWFAQRVVDVKLKYALTVDPSEAHALDAILIGCASTDLIFY